MSSDFAEFLFSFACNKLESSPQLDLRQQLLHSNLIRHILLHHHQQLPQHVDAAVSNGPAATTSALALPSADTDFDTDIPHAMAPAIETAHSYQYSSKKDAAACDSPQHLNLPPLPPSPPLSPVPHPRALQQQHPHHYQQQQHRQSHSFTCTSPSSSYHHPWSPYSFDDELDRIGHNHNNCNADMLPIQELDVDMDEVDASDASLYPTYINMGSAFGPAFQGYFTEPHHRIDYDFESSQAQEDWLDAVLEDLMEEDDTEDQDESVLEYGSDEVPHTDNDDDDDDDDDDINHDLLFDNSFGSPFGQTQFDIDIGQGPTVNALVGIPHKIDSEDGVLGRLLDQNGQRLLPHSIHRHIQRHHHPYSSEQKPQQQQQQYHQIQHQIEHQQLSSHPKQLSALAPIPFAHPYQSLDMLTSTQESLDPYQSFLHQSFSTKKGQQQRSAALHLIL
ncbi:hypothetical protein EDD11_007819 [Mortierella claussenii]|nr:hypothetical protein EDD11_007819 [Mortierella claussenii]